jgi:hypothetical protein
VLCRYWFTGGRLAWAAISDKIGRKNTFILFTAGSLPLYLALPTMVESVLSSGSTLPLYAFCLSTAMTVSVMGGSYAILPAYEADLFGTRFSGAVHGRMLLFSSAAALAGPPLFIYLRSLAEKKAVTELLTKVRTLSYHCTLSPRPSNLYSFFLQKISPETFQSAFGAPIESAMDLLASKTLSISKLLLISPPGTVDPSPYLYNDTMYALAGMMAVAYLSHSMVRPVAALPAVVTSAVNTATNGAAGAKIVDVTGTVTADTTTAVPPTDTVVGDRRVN